MGEGSLPATKSLPSPDMTRDRPVGVITGTGVSEQFDLGVPKAVKTPFGRAIVYDHKDGGHILVQRHGVAHRYPPHGINYRANIAALEQLGVKEIIATSAVGSMNQSFHVGKSGWSNSSSTSQSGDR